MAVFIEMEKLILKFTWNCMNSQNNLEKEEQSWTHTSHFQNLLQSRSNQDSVVLA